jgi:hypothetical protein
MTAFVQRTIDAFKEDQESRIEQDVIRPIQQALAIHEAEEKKRAEFSWRTREEDLHNDYAEEIGKQSARHTDYVDLLRNRIAELEAAQIQRETREPNSSMPNPMLSPKRPADSSFAEPPAHRTRTDQRKDGHPYSHMAASSEMGRTDHSFTLQHQIPILTSQSDQIGSKNSANRTRGSYIQNSYDMADLTATPVPSPRKRSNQRAVGTSRIQDRSIEVDSEEDGGSQINRGPSNGLVQDRDRDRSNGQLSQYKTIVPLQQPTIGATNGLTLSVARPTGLPIKILERDGFGAYKWRTTDTPGGLSKKLETALLHFVDSERKYKTFQRWLKAPKSCALTDCIGRFTYVSTFSHELTACNRCVKSQRPCVVLLGDPGSRQLGFMRLSDSMRSGTIEDVSFYVPRTDDTPSGMEKNEQH